MCVCCSEVAVKVKTLRSIKLFLLNNSYPLSRNKKIKIYSHKVQNNPKGIRSNSKKIKRYLLKNYKKKFCKQ